MTLTCDPAEKLIIALDGMSRSEVFEMISKIPELLWVKVGLELFVSTGPNIISDLRDKGLKVFLDLKFHDIPNTVAGACYQAASLGAEMMTVHACAGSKALLEAKNASVDGAKKSGLCPPKVLAVTVLTSWDERLFGEELLITQSIDERVDYLAKIAFGAGIDGCICSPREVANLRKIYPKPFELITPGIRLGSDLVNDQARVMTPSSAISLGASKLVVGRPVTLAESPCEAFENFSRELLSVL